MDSMPFTAIEAARLQAAIKADDDVGDASHSEPGSFVAAARSAIDVGRTADAKALAKGALALSPSNAPAWTALGDALWIEGDVAGARAAWEEALSLDDKDLGTAISCARAQLRMGAISSARALLTYVLTKTRSEALRADASALLDAAGEDVEVRA
jgi:Flp pilus assembly protein TadD